MRDALQPEWPRHSWPTKADAVAAAFEEMQGELDPVVFIHAAMCGVTFDQECDCAVEIVMEIRGQA